MLYRKNRYGQNAEESYQDLFRLCLLILSGNGRPKISSDGISGTSTKERLPFQRMVQDAKDGKIDMIITKSISRFARNTLDCRRYIRRLKEKNIPVYFEKESINTMDSKGEGGKLIIPEEGDGERLKPE